MKKVNKVFLALIAIFILSLSTVYADEINYKGKGTEEDPYILNFEDNEPIEVNYEGLPDNQFYFKIEKGKYIVEIANDRLNKKVVFTKAKSSSERLKVGAYINAGSTVYTQAGVITQAIGSEPGSGEKGYTITAIEKYVEENESSLPVGNFYDGSVTTGKYMIEHTKDSNGNSVLDFRNNLIQNSMIVLNNTIQDNDSKTYDHPLYNSVGKSGQKSYTLKNAIVNGVNSPEKYYVLTANGTVKDLYFLQSANFFAAFGAEDSSGNKLPVVRLVRDGNNNDMYKWEVAVSTTNDPTKFSFVTFATGKDAKNLLNLDITYKFDAVDDEEHAGAIQTAITKVLLVLGEILMLATRLFLGTDLTIDAIIFNKYDPTVLDLKSILYGTGTARGMFGNASVIAIVNKIYFAFQNLAIIAYIVMLLYIGVKVLASVGTAKQNKSFKYIENWIIGVIILFIAPRFFHYLTDISNSIVEYIGGNATPYYSEYNIVSMLGQDSLMGEDAQTVEIEKLIKEGIESREKQVESLTEKTNALENAKEGLEMQKTGPIARIQGKIASGILTRLYNTGNPRDKRKYDFMIASKVTPLGMLNYLQQYINDHQKELAQGESHYTNEYIEYRQYFKEVLDEDEGFKNSDAEKEIFNALDNYYDAMTVDNAADAAKELQILIDYLNNGGKTDLMAEMRARAGKTGKIVYALVWLALIFELYALLGLYYKRIIMVTILIMIFPLVMITYAIDKSGDGAAQTLGTWVKEFTVNVLIQIFHAIVYVVIINAGLEIYKANSNNWLFFFLAVLFLFPAERILRSIFGMNGSTLGNLKANVMSKVLLGATAVGMAKNATRLAGRGVRSTANFAKDVKDKGLKQTVKDKRDEINKAAEKDRQKREAETAKKRKAAQARADSRKKLRDSKIAERAAKYSAGDPRRLIMNGLAHARNGLYHAGNATRKIKSGVDKVANNKYVNKAYKLTKGTYNTAKGIAKKTAGVAMGTTSMVDNIGKGNLAGAITGGVTVGRKMGDFKTQPKLPKTPNQQARAQQRTMQQIPKTKANMPGGQKPLKSVNGKTYKPSTRSTRGAGGGKATIKGMKKVTTNKKFTLNRRTTGSRK